MAKSAKVYNLFIKYSYEVNINGLYYTCNKKGECLKSYI